MIYKVSLLWIEEEFKENLIALVGLGRVRVGLRLELIY